MRYLFLLFISAFAFAKVLAIPENIVKSSFSAKNVEVKNVMLLEADLKEVYKLSGQNLEDKIYRFYIAKDGSKILGYGGVITKKVRSKNATFLVLLTTDMAVKDIETISFDEPAEFIPSEKWLAQFDGKTASKIDQKNIMTMTGATLTARSVTQAAKTVATVATVVFGEKK